MEKFKSRKFLTMVITNLVMIVFAAGAALLTPETMDTVDRLVAVLTPLAIAGLQSRGYISTEGKNDALDLVRQIEEARKKGIDSVKVEL